MIKNHLANRWLRKVKDKNAYQIAEEIYLKPAAKRQDKDNGYVVLAELLSQYYRLGGKVIPSHSLLMPGLFDSDEPILINLKGTLANFQIKEKQVFELSTIKNN